MFKIKYKLVESLERYKARLVAKDYTQTFGMDCLETSLPIAKTNTLCVLLPLTINIDCCSYQFNV